GGQEVFSELSGVRVTLGEQHGRRCIDARWRVGALLDRDGSNLTVMLGKEAVRISRLQALLYLIANKAELIHLVAAVEPLPATASGGTDLLVPIPPAAQRLSTH